MRSSPVAENLKNNGIAWNIATRNADGSPARIDITHDGDYFGSVHGMKQIMYFGELMFHGETMNAALDKCDGWKHS